jgi:hypothetical protein
MVGALAFMRGQSFSVEANTPLDFRAFSPGFNSAGTPICFPTPKSQIGPQSNRKLDLIKALNPRVTHLSTLNIVPWTY